MKWLYNTVKSIQCRHVIDVLTVSKRQRTYKADAQLPLPQDLLGVLRGFPPCGTIPRSAPTGVIPFDREYADGYTAAITGVGARPCGKGTACIRRTSKSRGG